MADQQKVTFIRKNGKVIPTRREEGAGDPMPKRKPKNLRTLKKTSASALDAYHASKKSDSSRPSKFAAVGAALGFAAAKLGKAGTRGLVGTALFGAATGLYAGLGPSRKTKQALRTWFDAEIRVEEEMQHRKDDKEYRELRRRNAKKK